MKPLGYFIGELTFTVKDLFRCHKKRILVFCIAIALGLILGFRNGIKTEFTAQKLIDANSLIYRYIADKINIFTFILCDAFMLLLFCALYCFASCNKILSYLTALILFYRAYMLAFMIVLLISVFKLLILPYLLLCFSPLMLVYLALFFLLGLFIGDLCDSRWGGFSIENMTDCGIRMLPLFIAFVLLAIVEGILMLLLTFGIVI